MSDTPSDVPEPDATEPETRRGQVPGGGHPHPEEPAEGGELPGEPGADRPSR